MMWRSLGLFLLGLLLSTADIVAAGFDSSNNPAQHIAPNTKPVDQSEEAVVYGAAAAADAGFGGGGAEEKEDNLRDAVEPSVAPRLGHNGAKAVPGEAAGVDEGNNEDTPEPEASNGGTPEPEAINENTPEPEAINENTPEPEASNGGTPEPEAINENTPEPEASNGGTPEPEAINENTPEPEASNGGTPEPEAINENTPEPEASNANTPKPDENNGNTPGSETTNENTPNPDEKDGGTPKADGKETNTPVPETNTVTSAENKHVIEESGYLTIVSVLLLALCVMLGFIFYFGVRAFRSKWFFGRGWSRVWPPDADQYGKGGSTEMGRVAAVGTTPLVKRSTPSPSANVDGTSSLRRRAEGWSWSDDE